MGRCGQGKPMEGLWPFNRCIDQGQKWGHKKAGPTNPEPAQTITPLPQDKNEACSKGPEDLGTACLGKLIRWRVVHSGASWLDAAILILPRTESNQHMHLWPRKTEAYRMKFCAQKLLDFTEF